MNEKPTKTAEPSRRLGKMDLILIVIGVYLLIFSIAMMVIFVTTGSYPEELCRCTYETCTGEAGIMGVIKVFKVRGSRKESQSTSNSDEPSEDEPVG